MQKALWDIGAFKGIKDRHGREATLETAVDGINGFMTQQALANAKRMGYIQKNSRFIRNSNNSNTSSDKKQPITTSGANFPSQILEKASNQFTPEKFFDNLYPYGYSDDGTKFGGVKKVVEGIINKDKKREAVDEFVLLDLNDPQQRKRALELSKQFTNFHNSNLEQMQLSMRHRLDANNLYLGRKQQFGSWIVNPDYESPSAKAIGVPTYTYADPKLRRQQQAIARQHGINNGEGLHSVQGDVTSVFNNYSVNRMHPDGSGRYVEKWDFIGPDLGTPIIIGDTIPAR